MANTPKTAFKMSTAAIVVEQPQTNCVVVSADFEPNSYVVLFPFFRLVNGHEQLEPRLFDVPQLPIRFDDHMDEHHDECGDVLSRGVCDAALREIADCLNVIL